MANRSGRGWWWAAATLVLLGWGWSPAQAPGGEDVRPAGADVSAALAQMYAYDSSRPLDAAVVENRKLADSRREKVVFRGPDGEFVPAYVAVPAQGAGPFPCVVLMHGLGSSKEVWWDPATSVKYQELTRLLVAAGFAVAATDAVYHGERMAGNGFEPPVALMFRHGWPVSSREMIRRTVLDVRRLLDYLVTRPDIDATRIGVLGYSMGGMMSYIVTGVDTRVRAAVSCVGPPLTATMLRVTAIPPAALDSMMVVAPQVFAPAVGARPFLLLMGRVDPIYTEKQASQLFQLLPGSNKELVWFDCGHQLPPEFAPRAADWLRQRLNPAAAPE